MRRAHRVIDLMLANSDYTRDQLADHIDLSKVHVVHPGVQFDEFDGASAEGAAWRGKHGYDDRLVLFTIGRLDPRKNHAQVIRAVAALAPRYPELLYVIASDGRERERLGALAAQLGVSQRVVFAGAVDAATKRAMFGASASRS